MNMKAHNKVLMLHMSSLFHINFNTSFLDTFENYLENSRRNFCIISIKQLIKHQYYSVSLFVFKTQNDKNNFQNSLQPLRQLFLKSKSIPSLLLILLMIVCLYVSYVSIEIFNDNLFYKYHVLLYVDYSTKDKYIFFLQKLNMCIRFRDSLSIKSNFFYFAFYDLAQITVKHPELCLLRTKIPPFFKKIKKRGWGEGRFFLLILGLVRFSKCYRALQSQEMGQDKSINLQGILITDFRSVDFLAMTWKKVV